MVGTRIVMGQSTENFLTVTGRIRTISNNSSASNCKHFSSPSCKHSSASRCKLDSNVNDLDAEDYEISKMVSSESVRMCDNDVSPDFQVICDCDVSSSSQVIASRRRILRDRIIKTTILYTGILFLGLQWGVIGPSLPDLEQITGGSTTYIALILTGRNIASLIGSVLAGFLIDRYNNWLLLGSAHMVLGLMFAFALWSGDLTLLAICLIPSGLAAGFYDTGVNVAVLRLWISKPGPWIQAMECIDAVGSFIAPLLVQPFLSHNGATQTNDGNGIGFIQNSTHQLEINNVLTSSQPVVNNDYRYDVIVNNQTEAKLDDRIFVNLSHFASTVLNINGSFVNKTSVAEFSTDQTSQVMFAYLIVGILLMLVAVSHIAIFCLEKCDIYIKNDPINNESKSIRSNEQPQERKIRLLILPLLFFICFAYYALETGYAHYLMTFCVKHLKWSKGQGVAVTSAFWGAYTTGTAMGIFIIKYVRPRTMLTFDVTLCLTSQVILVCFLNYHPAVVWACTIAAGLSISTIFASVFSWTQKNIGISGKVNALLMVGMATGEMTSPAIIGILMDKSGAISWVYCMLTSSLLCMTSFILMHILANKRKVMQREVNMDPSAVSSTGGLNVKFGSHMKFVWNDKERTEQIGSKISGDIINKHVTSEGNM